MINRGGPTAGGAHRRPDRRQRRPHRRRLRRGARQLLGLTALNTAIEELDGERSRRRRSSLCSRGAEPAARPHRLVPAQRRSGRGLADIVAHYQSGIAAVVDGLNALMPPEAIEARAARAAKLVGQGISEALALRIADLPALTAATDAILISDRTASRSPTPRRPTSRRSGISSSTASSAVSAPSRSVRLFRAPRPLTGRSIPSAIRCAASPPRRPPTALARGHHRLDGLEGRRRARARGDPRRSPHRGSARSSCRSPRTCSATSRARREDRRNFLLRAGARASAIRHGGALTFDDLLVAPHGEIGDLADAHQGEPAAQELANRLPAAARAR